MQIVFQTMKHMLPIILALSLMPQGANGDDREARTVAGEVLCATPFQLRKAIIALHSGDEGRIRRLGCMKTSDGMKVVLLDQRVPFAGPWQVLLVPEGGPAFSMWGYAWSFRTVSGKRLWPKAQ